MGRLDDRVAVITGAADGIGEASARLFVEEGAAVVLADIDDEKGRAVARELGAKAIYTHADVTRPADVSDAIELALRHFGRLDCMYNNAGAGGQISQVEDLAVEEFDRIMALILRGPFLGIKYAARVMRKQGTGSIISTASVAGFRTGDSDLTYSAAKAGLIQMTRYAAMELGESGVRVNCISPGWVVTDTFRKAAQLSREDYAARIPALKSHLATFQPIKRAELPADVARAALWLASDDSAFVNGHNLVVDGGMTNGKTWTQVIADMTGVGKILMG
jgi:NAD(P)-dependent dehydrogenase (short-subunit alcohol dehydrogenase family)